MIFIYSTDSFLIKKQLNKTINSINSDNEFEIFAFSLIEDPLSVIYAEIATYSLFSKKKIIIINDCWFVTENKIKLHKDFDIKSLERILENYNHDDIKIIMTLNYDKLSKRLKITKQIEKKAKFLKLNPLSLEEKKEFLTKKITKAAITYEEDALNLFLEYVNDDMLVFINEINKLIILNKHITKEMIKENIFKYYQFNIFDILNTFIKKDLNEFMKNWSPYFEVNNNIFAFISMLSNQFIILRNSLLLYNRGENYNQIASSLNQNPYRISKLLSQNLLDITEINDKIKMLYTLEKNIKDGFIDNKIIPELELIKMFCN